MEQASDENLSSLKAEFLKLDRAKEDLFSQIKGDKAKINELRSKVIVLKKERNIVTDSVKKIKAERDEFNKQLKIKIDEYKKVAPPVKKVENKGPKVNVAFIKKEIKDLEYKVETSGLSFDKEQKLMKLIKEKRKLIAGSDGPSMPENVKVLSKEIDELRRNADSKHREMRVKADESQKKHEEVISNSNQLKELENKNRGIEKQIREYKAKLEEIRAKLGPKLEEEAKNRKEHHERSDNRRQRPKFDKKKEQHRGPHVNIEQMQHKAEEKLKKGGKLTTEDLLAFQNKR